MIERKLNEILEPNKLYNYSEIIKLLPGNNKSSLLHYLVMSGQIEICKNATYKIKQ